MIKGGYKIVNFNGATLSGTAVTLAGIYHQIVDDYDKPIMVSGVSLNGKLQDDAYADVQEKTAQDLSKSVELTVYGGIITVTEDDEVTYASVKSNTELTVEIGDIDDLETIDKDSVVDAINELNSKMLPYNINTGDANTFADGVTLVTDTITQNLPTYSRFAVITFTLLDDPVRKVQIAIGLGTCYVRGAAPDWGQWTAWHSET